ncbi:MAG TPA: hypothetical protein VJI75_00085 [Candidatus Nanoarchaeia archaeon]|nr:hypothetical protein [Candidatus Nanoarchaeia archaeon]
MDVERLQKVTRLAKDLYQRGMAADMEEAAKVADDLINKDNDLSQIRNTLAGRDADAPEPSSSGAIHVSELQVSMPQQQTSSSVLDSYITDINSKITEIVNEIKSHDNRILELRGAIIKVGDAIDRLDKERKEFKPIMERSPGNDQTRLSPESIKKDAPHPKVGGFNSADVCVENVFYCGPPR